MQQPNGLFAFFSSMPASPLASVLVTILMTEVMACSYRALHLYWFQVKLLSIEDLFAFRFFLIKD